MQDLIERLRAQKAEYEAAARAKEEAEARGQAEREAHARGLGREWARAEATYEALKELADIQGHPARRLACWHDHFGIGPAAETFVRTVQPDDYGEEAVARFWAARGVAEPDGEFVRDFADGAVEIWDEVKNRL